MYTQVNGFWHPGKINIHAVLASFVLLLLCIIWQFLVHIIHKVCLLIPSSLVHFTFDFFCRTLHLSFTTRCYCHCGCLRQVAVSFSPFEVLHCPLIWFSNDMNTFRTSLFSQYYVCLRPLSFEHMCTFLS